MALVCFGKPSFFPSLTPQINCWRRASNEQWSCRLNPQRKRVRSRDSEESLRRFAVVKERVLQTTQYLFVAQFDKLRRRKLTTCATLKKRVTPLAWPPA